MAKKTRKRPNQRIPASSQTRSARRNSAMVFARRNYIILLAAVGVVLLGYVVMRVENEVEGFLSLYVGPMMVLGGYLGVIYAVLWKEKPNATQ